MRVSLLATTAFAFALLGMVDGEYQKSISGENWQLVMKLSKNDFCYGSSRWTDGAAFNTHLMNDDAYPSQGQYDAKSILFHTMQTNSIKLQSTQGGTVTMEFTSQSSPQTLMTTNSIAPKAYPVWSNWLTAFGCDRHSNPTFVRGGTPVNSPTNPCRTSAQNYLRGCGKVCTFCMQATNGAYACGNNAFGSDDVSTGLGLNAAYCGGGNAATCSTGGTWNAGVYPRILVWAKLLAPDNWVPGGPFPDGVVPKSFTLGL